MPTNHELSLLFRRSVFVWLIADGDMHLKNLAILKTADAGAKVFSSVRFALLYDAVTTRVFPRLVGDRMALMLNGKDDRLRLQDFLTLARTIGLPGAEAAAALADLTARLSRRAGTLDLPEFARGWGAANTMRDRVIGIVAERSAALMETVSRRELPELNPYRAGPIRSGGAVTAEATVTVTVTDVPEALAFAREGYAFALAENAEGSTEPAPQRKDGRRAPEGPVGIATTAIDQSGPLSGDNVATIRRPVLIVGRSRTASRCRDAYGRSERRRKPSGSAAQVAQERRAERQAGSTPNRRVCALCHPIHDLPKSDLHHRRDYRVVSHPLAGQTGLQTLQVACTLGASTKYDDESAKAWRYGKLPAPLST